MKVSSVNANGDSFGPRNLNFTSLVSEDDDYTFSKKKVARVSRSLHI